jgi:hypothetical protein
MEFHGKIFMKKNPSNVYEQFHEIPWNSTKFSMEFHKISWNFMKLRLMHFRGFLWYSMENFMEFHGISWNSMEFREFMEFHEIRFGQGRKVYLGLAEARKDRRRTGSLHSTRSESTRFVHLTNEMSRHRVLEN